MNDERWKKHLLSVIIVTIALVSGTATPGEAVEFSPKKMQQAAGLMSDLFNSLPQDQEFMRYARDKGYFRYDRSDVKETRNFLRPTILLLRIDLFNLSAVVGSFQQRALQNSLDESLFRHVGFQIRANFENFEETFSEFVREVFRGPFKRRYQF
jgi:hypothetical protein